MKYEVKNGELYQDGVKVILEVGNTEQINFIKKYSEMVENFNGSGLVLDVEVEKQTIITTSFKCICGEGYVYLEYEGGDYDDESDIIGMKSKCRTCKQEYEIDENEEGNIVAKITKTK